MRYPMSRNKSSAERLIHEIITAQLEASILNLTLPSPIHTRSLLRAVSELE